MVKALLFILLLPIYDIPVIAVDFFDEWCILFKSVC